MADFLREKYAAAPPEVIIVGGQEALDFWLRHREEVFPGVPVVHLAVSVARLEQVRPLPPGFVGIPIDHDVVGTIEQALRWHPAARRLVVVTDASPWDREWEQRLRALTAQLAGRLAVEFLVGLPIDELQRRLRDLPADAIVYSPGFFVDGSGRAFLPREAVRLVAAASAAPVYGPFSTHRRHRHRRRQDDRLRRHRAPRCRDRAGTARRCGAGIAGAAGGHADGAARRLAAVAALGHRPANAARRCRGAVPHAQLLGVLWPLGAPRRRGRAAAGRIHRRAPGRAAAPAGHGGRAPAKRAAHEPGRPRGRTVDVGVGRRRSAQGAAGARAGALPPPRPVRCSTLPARSSTSTRPTATGSRRSFAVRSRPARTSTSSTASSPPTARCTGSRRAGAPTTARASGCSAW